MVRKVVKVIRLGILMVLTLAAVGMAITWASTYLIGADESGVVWQLGSDYGTDYHAALTVFEDGDSMLSVRTSLLFVSHSYWEWTFPTWDSPYDNNHFFVVMECWGGVWMYPDDYDTNPSAEATHVYETYSISILSPLWGTFVLFAFYPTIAFIRGPVRRWRRRKRGLCVRCGYNLTGNESGVCPECGTEFDPATVPRAVGADTEET